MAGPTAGRLASSVILVNGRRWKALLDGATRLAHREGATTHNIDPYMMGSVVNQPAQGKLLHNETRLWERAGPLVKPRHFDRIPSPIPREANAS